MSEARSVPLDDIRLDGGTQLREAMNLETIRNYALVMDRGEELPPVVLFNDGEALWMADGFHRYYSHKEAGRREILAEVRSGDLDAAWEFAAQANRRHGLPQTRADKKKAVRAMLERFYPTRRKTHEEIAKLCGVARSTVTQCWGKIEEEREEQSRLSVVSDWHGQIDDDSQALVETSPSERRPDWARDWPAAVVSRAMDAVEKLPEGQQETLLHLVSAPGVPPQRAMETLENLASMSEEERQRVVVLAESKDERDQSAAVAIARKLPYVDPRWTIVEMCRQDLEKCLRLSEEEHLIAACKIVLGHLQGLIGAIEDEERRRVHVTA